MFLYCFINNPKNLTNMFNQILSHINWLHVAVAAIAYFALGALWYSPLLFVKKWIELLKINVNDPDAKKGMAALFITSFILMLVTTIGLAVLMQILPAVDVIGGIKLGLFIAVCFSTTSVSINYVYTKKPFMLYLIDCGYHIAGIVIASAILSAWH